MGGAQKDDALFKKVLPQAAQVHRTCELISQVCLICKTYILLSKDLTSSHDTPCLVVIALKHSEM